MSKQAWVTLATNDSYALGALVLAHSLRRVSSAFPAVVIITPSVTDNMRGRLGVVFGEVVVVDVLDSRDAAHLALLARPELGITFTKIHCWSLTQYEKCVFLDADTLVLQNCDELFEREELSAAPDVGWPDCFNSGVFVYRPSAETFSSLLQFAQERGSFDGGDQGLLNSYFSSWAHGDITKHLPFLYNVTSAAFYSYLPALKHYGENLKIIHFIGTAKPWLQRFNWESRAVSGGEGHLLPTLQLWWDIFVQDVHPQLDDTMSFKEESKQEEVERDSFVAPPAPAAQASHYTIQGDPDSEFPWHRPEADTPSAQDLDRQLYVERCLAEFHDPWEHYRGNVPATDEQHNTQVQARVELHNEVNVEWTSYKSQSPSEHHQLHSCPPFQYQHDDWPAHIPVVHDSKPTQSDHQRDSHSTHSYHRHESVPQNDYQHGQPSHDYYNHNDVPKYHPHHDDSLPCSRIGHNDHDDPSDSKGQPPAHHTHSQVFVDTASYQQFHEAKPPETSAYSAATAIPAAEEPAACNGGAPDWEYDSAESETECRQKVEEVRPRHPYDNYYLLHRSVMSTRGCKRCSHEPPTPPPTPPPPPSPPPPPPPGPQLQPEQAGLAGTLSRLTLGAAAPQQAALDEHTRRQGWEAGNIDYLGADSFANIWAKISATLAQSPPAPAAPALAPAPESAPESPAAPEQTLEPVVPECESCVPAPVPAPAPVETSVPAPIEPESPASIATPEPAPVVPLVAVAVEHLSTASIETPVPTSAEPPVAAPIETPVTELVESPVAASVETPAAAPIEMPVAEPAEHPTAAPIELPVAATIESPLAAPVEPPAAAPVETPVGEHAGAPTAPPVVCPVSSPVEPPAAATVEPPVAETIISPVTATVQSPAATTVETSLASAETLEPPMSASAAEESATAPTQPRTPSTQPPPVDTPPFEPPTDRVEAPTSALAPAEASSAQPTTIPIEKVPESSAADPTPSSGVATEVTEVPQVATVIAEVLAAAPQPQTPVASPEATPAPAAMTPPAASPVSPPLLLSSSDSPPLVSTPVKDTESPKSAEEAKSDTRIRDTIEGDEKADSRKAPPKDKLFCQLKPSAEPAPLLTPDSELEDAATLAQSIIASELTPATPSVTSATPPALATPTPLALNQKRLSVEEPVLDTPPVSLAQIGIVTTTPGTISTETKTSQKIDAQKVSIIPEGVAATEASEKKTVKTKSGSSPNTPPTSAPATPENVKPPTRTSTAKEAAEPAKVAEPTNLAVTKKETESAKVPEPSKMVKPAELPKTPEIPPVIESTKVTEPAKSVKPVKLGSKVAPLSEKKVETKFSEKEEPATPPVIEKKSEKPEISSKSATKSAPAEVKGKVQQKEDPTVESKTEDAPAEPPKKKIVKKVVKKESAESGGKSEASGGDTAAAPVPPPRKKVQKPKEK